MDCEKFENLLIDELYGELDEVTSAAVRRHAAGCARCGAMLSGLRATRKVAALPIEEPSADLEDRILSAVREQQKVLPLRARFAMAVSRAGAWAMRPQTAMAAVFLVVIGTSFVLVQSRTKNAAMPAAVVNAEGAPVAAKAAAPMNAPMASALALEQKESAFAHGVEEKKLDLPFATATAAPSTLALADDQSKADGLLDNKDKVGGAGGGGVAQGAEREIANAAPIGGTTGGPYALKTAAQGQGAVASRAEAAGEAQAPPPPPAEQAAPGHLGDASDPQAALRAGRVEKQQRGCTSAAIQAFESARTRAPSGSAVANDATLEAANCYRAVGNTALARARYSQLLGQPGYAANAQNELDRLAPSAVAHKAEVRAPSPARATPQATHPAQVDQGNSF